MFTGLFDSTTITVAEFMLVVCTGLVLGIVISLLYAYKNKASSSFVVTLALLPAAVSVVIMMVNGNIGAGVAVAGAFSLVRFRSAPGSAKEIASIFTAMGTGLILGMGYLGYAILFALVMGAAQLVLTVIRFGEKKADLDREIRITIPEDLNYTDAFDDIFSKYTDSFELKSVRTTNMGSMFKLKYLVTVKDARIEKEMIDELRSRNGNLEIAVSRCEDAEISTL